MIHALGELPMMGVVSINGRLLPRREARVHVADGGFLHGEGVFETIRLYEGEPLLLQDHFERLSRGARLLGLACPPEGDFRRQIKQLVCANRLRGDGICRLSVSRAPVFSRAKGGAPERRSTRVLILRAIPEGFGRMGARGIAARTLDFQRATGPSASLKTLSYLSSLLALRAADLAGAAEAIFVSPIGQVLEGATTNVFALVGGVLVTPPATGHLVPGVLRSRLLALARSQSLPLEETPLSREALETAPEIFLTNAVREIIPVVRLNDRRLGSGRPGAATLAVQEAWRSHISDLLSEKDRKEKRRRTVRGC